MYCGIMADRGSCEPVEAESLEVGVATSAAMTTSTSIRLLASAQVGAHGAEVAVADRRGATPIEIHSGPGICLISRCGQNL